MYIEEFTTTIVGASVTVIGGLIASLLAKKLTREKQLEREQTDKIVDAVKSGEAARRAATLDSLIQKLPGGLASVDELMGSLQKLVSELPASPAVPTTEVDAVEGLITGYHEQALGQARVQFWFSLFAATVGFGWILYAARDIQPDHASTVLKTLPGIVMDAVAFLFFRQASETRQRATELYDRLRKDRQLTEARSVVDAIEDIKIRSTVQAQIALHMSGLQPVPIDLMKFTHEPKA